MFSKLVQKVVENGFKTTVVASNVENLGKLSIHQVKNNHRLVSTFIAKPFSNHLQARERQPRKQTEEDEQSR